MRIGSTRSRNASAGAISPTAIDTWSTWRAGMRTGSTAGAEVPELGVEARRPVLDHHVAPVAERAGVQDERVADAIHAAPLVDVADDRDVGPPRLDERSDRRTPDRAAVHEPVEPRVERWRVTDHQAPR